MEGNVNSAFEGMYDRSAIPSMPGNFDTLGETDNVHVKLIKQFVQLFEALKRLKDENPEYKKVTEDMLYLFYTEACFGSSFPAEYSHEHAAGFKQGVGMFCMPENFLKLYKEILNKNERNN